MKRRLSKTVIAAVLSMLATTAPAFGDIIIDTINSNMGRAQSIEGLNFFDIPGTASGLSAAVQWTPSANYELTDASVFVAQDPFSAGDDGLFNVFIAADNGGIPGGLLEQIGFNLVAPLNYNPITEAPGGTIVTADSVSTPLTLDAGTSYWLILTPGDANSQVSWGLNSSTVSPYSQAFNSTGDGGWQSPLSGQKPEFEIDGTLVSETPEPGFSPIVPLLLWYLRAKRRNLGFR